LERKGTLFKCQGDKTRERKGFKYDTFRLSFGISTGEETGFLSGKQLLGLPKKMTTVPEKAIVVFLQLLWNELKIEADV